MPDLGSLTSTELAFLIAGFAVFAAYVVFLIAPAWGSYGRVWERIAASFLTIYMLAALLAVGAIVGVAVVAIYANFI